jgi:thymidylate synthase (FAD)
MKNINERNVGRIFTTKKNKSSMKIAPISVELIDCLGTDLSVVNAARVSFSKVSTEFTEQDAKLINYLAKHNHWTPFAHAFLSFRIKAPIFVARQLVKHQVGLAWNEVSRRYVDSEPEFYWPTEWRGRPENAKQGSSGVLDFQVDPRSCLIALDTYNKILKNGVAPEQARMVLPLNTHTEWIWSGSLAALARVCKLRLDPHAQKECTDTVQPIYDILLEKFPVSTKALVQ